MRREFEPGGHFDFRKAYKKQMSDAATTQRGYIRLIRGKNCAKECCTMWELRLLVIRSQFEHASSEYAPAFPMHHHLSSTLYIHDTLLSPSCRCGEEQIPDDRQIMDG